MTERDQRLPITRWGILGTGAVAQSFARDLKLLPGAVLAAVTSRRPERARAFRDEFGVTRFHDTLEKFLRDEEIDVVYVATPHVLHREHAVACLQADKAVLCEKPFALNEAQGRRIVDAARASRRFCMEAMWMRFHPLIRTVRSMIQGGEIGAVRMLRAEFGYPLSPVGSSRFFDLAAGGGALLDRGVYPISLAHYLLGEPAEATGQAFIGSTGVDEQDAVVLRYSSGALASLGASLTARLGNDAVIVGSRGEIRIHEPFYAPHRVTIRRFGEPGATPADEEITAGGWKSYLKRQPVVRRAVETLARPLLHELKGVDRQSHYATGQGYQFEAEEVMSRLGAGELESPLMSLDDTLAIARITDGLRRSWGLRYPGED
ncbi:MAG TPA: Gfo/Idh/MocA family oxidoreductase [Polyangiaceae bacterium]|nr:Gfo/Idh/MocA family oxidoreductase [Polyangiaceae bacterium]